MQRKAHESAAMRLIKRLSALTLLLLAACQDDPLPTAGGARLDQSATPAAATAHGRGRFADEAASFALAAEVPGFGGWFIDANGDVNAWVTDLKNEGVARAAVTRAIRGRARSAHQKSGFQIIIRRAQFSWSELSGWRDLVDSTSRHVAEMRSLDISERANRLVIGVSHAGARASVRSRIAALGVPDDAISMQVETCEPTALDCGGNDYCSNNPSDPSCTEDYCVVYPQDPNCDVPPEEENNGYDPSPDPGPSCPPGYSCVLPAPAVNGTVVDFHSVVKAGIQIGFYDPEIGADRCTIGFVAISPAYGNVFITNSHCDDVQGGTGSYNDFGQPTSSSPLGIEAFDPPYTHSTRSWYCRFWKCRESDAAIIRITDNRGFGLGLIARPRIWAPMNEGSGTLEIDQSQPTLQIVGEHSPMEGDIVDKVGAYSGWTYDSVTSVCKIRYQGGTGPRWHYCQSTANYYLGPGDSGAPVFLWMGNQVRLIGIHHSKHGFLGREGKGGIFSPMSQIRTDLGALRTHP